MNKYLWIDVALDAQIATIKDWLSHNYARKLYKISGWNDHNFSIIRFSANQCNKDFSLSARRRALDKLAAAGVIERIKRYEYGRVTYKFPRQVCDVFAQQAIDEYLAEGYSQKNFTPKMPLEHMQVAA